jgi:hypothetical protein
MWKRYNNSRRTQLMHAQQMIPSSNPNVNSLAIIVQAFVSVQAAETRPGLVLFPDRFCSVLDLDLSHVIHPHPHPMSPHDALENFSEATT